MQKLNDWLLAQAIPAPFDSDFCKWLCISFRYGNIFICGYGRMLPLTPELLHAYDAMLAQKKVADGECNDYRKWLRYYLDYCHKYHVSPAGKLSFSAFHKN